MEVSAGAERPRRRARVVFSLAAGAGILFVAAIVGEKQRIWELRQRTTALEESYGEELSDSSGAGSAAQKLKALRQMMERTSLELQGSDRAQSRAIKHEEKLVALPNLGVEEGAGAEWASGGANRHHELHQAVQDLPTQDLAGPSSGSVTAQASTASALQRKADSLLLAADIHRQELLARATQAHDAGRGAMVTPPIHGGGGVANSAIQTADATAPRAQQLAQLWRGGGGAVYAPSVMTSYQQQMLESYMGAPSLPSPPATQSVSAPPQSLASNSATGHAPSSQLSGAALAEAWKSYLDPESLHHSKVSPVDSGKPAKNLKSSNFVAGVGKAVVSLAEDSDGVLKHAEVIMSSVKKLLARPEKKSSVVSGNKDSGAQNTLTAQQAADIAKAASEGAVTAVLKKQDVKGKKASPMLHDAVADRGKLHSAFKGLAAATAEHQVLERELAKMHAAKSKALAPLDGARTQALVAVQSSVDTPGRNSSSHVPPANATESFANGTALLKNAARGVADHSRQNSTLGDGGMGKAHALPAVMVGLPKLPVLPPTPAVRQAVEATEGVDRVQVLPAERVDQVQVLPTVESRPESEGGKEVKKGKGAGAGVHGPMVDVNIRDSKIMGGLHISRNTGERTGPGAESGCGALCELGKMMQNMQGDSRQVTQMHSCLVLLRAACGIYCTNALSEFGY